MFPSELIDLHRDREKTILDSWLDTKGLNVLVTPVRLSDNGERVDHDLDPFNIEIDRIGYEEGAVMNYDGEYDQKAIFSNEQFQFTEISYGILTDETDGIDSGSNLNEAYCFIGGVIVPKYSLISFEDFPNVKLRVDEVLRKRPLSDIYRYKLVRC